MFTFFLLIEDQHFQTYWFLQILHDGSAENNSLKKPSTVNSLLPMKFALLNTFTKTNYLGSTNIVVFVHSVILIRGLDLARQLGPIVPNKFEC